MALISCDMRYGRSDEQKRQLAAGLLRVVSGRQGKRRMTSSSSFAEGRGQFTSNMASTFRSMSTGQRTIRTGQSSQ